MKLNKAVVLFGLSSGFTATVVLYHTFLCAYFNGMTTRVHINTIGEANIEFIFIPIMILTSLASLIIVLNWINKGKIT